MLCSQRYKLFCWAVYKPSSSFNQIKKLFKPTQFCGKFTIFSFAGAWRAAVDDANQWIEADFRVMRRLISVTTRADRATGHWVTSYTISHSHNRIYWNNIPDQFDGNGDSTWPKTNMLPGSRLARYIRLFPRAWHMSISLAWDVTWCRVTRE